MKNKWSQVSLHLTTMVMEGLCLYVLIRFLNSKVADGALNVYGLLFSYLLSFGINRLLKWWRLPKRYAYPANLPIWSLVFLLIIRIELLDIFNPLNASWLLDILRVIVSRPGPSFTILVVSLIIWVLGIRLARVKIGFTTIITDFQFGLVMLAIIFFAAYQLEVPITGGFMIVLAFITAALLGISIGRAASGNSWFTSRHRDYWIALLLVSIVMVLVLGIFLAAILTPDLLQTALRMVVALFEWLFEVTQKAMTGVANIISPDSEMEFEPMAPTTEMDTDPDLLRRQLNISLLTRNILRVLVNAIWASIIILALWRLSSWIFSRLHSRTVRNGDVEIELISGSFWRDLSSLIRRVLHKLLARLLFWRRRGVSSAVSRPVNSVRDIYRQLLSWATREGWPRVPFQTPSEYLVTLEAMLPSAHDELRYITRSYISTRYGATMPTRDELSELKRYWQRIKSSPLERFSTDNSRNNNTPGIDPDTVI